MANDEFEFLRQMIGGYLHQDMDLEADSVPEAIAVFARHADAPMRDGVVSDMQSFMQQYHNRAADEFAQRFGRDFTPDEIGQSVGEFFEMVNAILIDPDSYQQFL